MGPVLPIVGAATGVMGGINSKNQAKAANAAAQSSADAQQKISQGLLQNINSQTDQYNKEYAPQLGTLASGMGAGGQAASNNIGQLSQMLMQAGMDPSVISQITGIDANQLTKNLVNYEGAPGSTQTGQIGNNVVGSLMNTGGTNLAGVNPAVSGFYQGEMQHGIDPQYAQNAQNQIQQALNTQQQNILANAQPGQNTNSLLKDLNNQALTQSTNLAGNLAGLNQQTQAAGAQGLASTAQGLDAQKSEQLLSALQAAGVIDSQTMQMLQNAANAGTAANQQQFDREGTSLTAGSGLLSNLQNFLQQGQNAVESSYGPMSGLAGQYGNAAVNSANQAANANQQMGQSYGSAANSLAGLFPQSRQSSPVSNSPDMGAASFSGWGPQNNTSSSSYRDPMLSGSFANPMTTTPGTVLPSTNLLGTSNGTNLANPLGTSSPNFTRGMFPQQMSGQNYMA